jgi:hypothetical protein
VLLQTEALIDREGNLEAIPFDKAVVSMIVWVKAPGYLSRVSGVISVLEDEANVDVGELIAGDVNSDNVIDEVDLEFVKSVLGSSNELADFDSSGRVDVFDYALLSKNYRVSGEGTNL